MGRPKGAKDSKPRKARSDKPKPGPGRPREYPKKPPRMGESKEPLALRGTHPPPPRATPGSTVAWAKIVRMVTERSFDDLQSLVAAMTKAPLREMIVLKAAMQAAGISLVKGDDGRVKIETTDRPDMRAIEWLANREEGAPVQATTIGNPDGSAIAPTVITIVRPPKRNA